EPPDEWRAVKDCLYVGTRQLACSLVSHGFTITLPNTIRSSSNLKASFVSGNASSRSMIGLSLPELMRSKRVVRSSRIQPLEPRMGGGDSELKRPDVPQILFRIETGGGSESQKPSLPVQRS